MNESRQYFQQKEYFGCPHHKCSIEKPQTNPTDFHHKSVKASRMKKVAHAERETKSGACLERNKRKYETEKMIHEIEG